MAGNINNQNGNVMVIINNGYNGISRCIYQCGVMSANG